MTKSYDPFSNMPPWMDQVYSGAQSVVPPTITTSKVEIDPHRLQAVMGEILTRVRDLERRNSVLERTVHDLERLAKFIAQNPGSTLDDWVAYEKVKTTITEAAKQGDTDGKKNR